MALFLLYMLRAKAPVKLFKRNPITALTRLSMRNCFPGSNAGAMIEVLCVCVGTAVKEGKQ